MNVPETDTDLLLRRTKEGDRQARDQLLERHRHQLRRMVEIRIDPRIARRVDPSDVVQEALLDAAKRLPQYIDDQPLPFLPWLRQFAQNRLIDAHRRHLARKRDVNREADWHLSDHSVRDLAKLLVTDATSPSRGVSRTELNERVRQLLSGMKPTDREILVLRHLEELSIADIASVLGITESAAKKRQVRALLRLRQQLGEDNSDASET
ncbi:MAG: sigma-70 family RNA polymerase sigma factor [Planctomycetales bacterium]|nr:sigma-70 family RNA polymerase sigma factor [Planctomycetales bacterium]